MSEKQKKIIDEAEYYALQEKVKRMKQLNSLSGFTRAYWERIPHHPTYNDAFNSVNEEYFHLFGEYRYASWDTFRNAIKNAKKK